MWNILNPRDTSAKMVRKWPLIGEIWQGDHIAVVSRLNKNPGKFDKLSECIHYLFSYTSLAKDLEAFRFLWIAVCMHPITKVFGGNKLKYLKSKDGTGNNMDFALLGFTLGKYVL